MKESKIAKIPFNSRLTVEDHKRLLWLKEKTKDTFENIISRALRVYELYIKNKEKEKAKKTRNQKAEKPQLEKFNEGS